jgi:glycine/D-amino acid oxidase-like deaminating enzyme
MGSRKRIVICGAGAIGAAIAYFIGRRGAQAIVIERHEVAGAASGKSGGFLALDWCRGSSLDRPCRRSRPGIGAPNASLRTTAAARRAWKCAQESRRR